MFDKKRSSRPADTGTTAKRDVMRKTSHKDYNTQFKKMQGLVAIFAIIILLILTIWVAIDVSAQNSARLQPIEHKVTYGETLWSIADKYKPEDMTKDRYMAWVYEHNEGGMIYPGDVVIMAEVE